VQFSATAYSPRLVLWVARDAVVSHALGVFSATFLYALVMLAWVDREAAGKVPFISACLVFFFTAGERGDVHCVDRTDRDVTGQPHVDLHRRPWPDGH
jgi:hypothetical protein